MCRYYQNELSLIAKKPRLSRNQLECEKGSCNLVRAWLYESMGEIGLTSTCVNANNTPGSVKYRKEGLLDVGALTTLTSIEPVLPGQASLIRR